MGGQATSIFRFGRFELDTAERTLRRDGTPVPLAPRAFDTLRMLVENGGRVISKERMLSEIWQGSFVEENNLAQNISLLRKVLTKGGGGKFIETVPKFGYRFVAVTETGEPETGLAAGTLPRPPAAATFSKPETNYVRSGDVNIAYQVVGGGAIDIVFVMGWVSHLEYFWEEPHFASLPESDWRHFRG